MIAIEVLKFPKLKKNTHYSSKNSHKEQKPKSLENRPPPPKKSDYKYIF